MKSPVATGCVFSTALMIAHSLLCFSSYNIVPGEFSEREFDKMTKKCTSSQDACMLIFYVIDKRSDKKLNGYMYHIRCGQQSDCDVTASMTTAGFYISYNTTCCNTDRCIPPHPVLPERSQLKNGVTCPACHVERQDPCVPERAMACTGEETHCVLQNSTMFKAYFAYSSGCATKTILKDNGDFINSLHLLNRFVVTEISSEHQLQVGNFLWCHECQEEQSASCAKYQVLCHPDRDVCLSEMRRITEDPSRKLTMQTVRRCGNSDECKVDGTVTGRGKTITIKTSCCETDMCDPPNVFWSLKRIKTNGKMCPLYSLSNNYYPDVVQCTGDETYCINFTSLITEDIYSREESLHGCAMANICENGLIKEYQSASNKMSIKNDIVCSKGVMIMCCLLRLALAYVFALTVLRD